MFRMNEIRPAAGSTRNSKRRGRGIGSGNGKTAGRGHKGAGSRSGTKKKLYFEGGQTPLTRRIPKRGFVSVFKKTFQIVNIGDIAAALTADHEVNAEWLFDNGLIQFENRPRQNTGQRRLRQKRGGKGAGVFEIGPRKNRKGKRES